METKRNNRKITMLLDRQWFEEERKDVADRAAKLGMTVTNYLRSLVRADLLTAKPQYKGSPGFFAPLKQGNPKLMSEQPKTEKPRKGKR